MRCKRHPSDLSSAVGVCATCLRDRLSAIIAAQLQVERANHQAQLARAHSHAAPEDSRKSDSQPPPLIFPRSVSPYVTRRKTDDDSWSSNHHNLHFYSTPQLGPTYISSTTTGITTTGSFNKKHSRFPLFSRLFKHRSDRLNSNGSGPGISSHNSSDGSSSSPSWFSSIFTRRRKKQSEDSGAVGHKPCRRVDRGMSPVRVSDPNEDCEDCDRSPSGSGYSSESSQGWRRTPVAPAAIRRGKSANVRNVSGITFCLSPLVRASPKRQWNHKGVLAPDMSFSGEVRIAGKPHLSTAASFCANRSRKLADFGRLNHNR